MQRDQLEGWMVMQVERADLARDTVLQIPVHAAKSTTDKETSLRSPRSAVGSPRCVPHGTTTAQRPSTTPTQPRPPAERITQHRKNPRTPLDAAVATVSGKDGENTIARQWRMHFRDPRQQFVEDGRVNRKQVIMDNGRTSSSSPHRRQCFSGNDNDDDSDGDESWGDPCRSGETSNDTPPSKMLLWGLPREYILEYIRQSIMPSSHATHPGLMSEWEVVKPREEQSVCHDKHYRGIDAAALLPPLSTRSKQSGDSPAHTTPSKSTMKSKTGGASPMQKSFQPIHAEPPPSRVKATKREERINRVLTELRSDPKLWTAFQEEVRVFLEKQHIRQNASDKIRENKKSAMLSPRDPSKIADRKRQNDERHKRYRLQHERLQQEEAERMEAKLAAYRRKVDARLGVGKEVDVTQSSRYRRCKLWLVGLAFANTSTALQHMLTHAKQRQVIERMQTQAAQIIQCMWKKWKWRHASKHTIIVYTWLRRCLWRLTFKVRCRRKRQHALLLQRFLLENCTGSHETRNFNRMMIKWRAKVIHCQRLGLGFVACTRARLYALSLRWDSIDHDRQRSERHMHERTMPTTDEKEVEWQALVSNRRLARSPSIIGSARAPLTPSAANVTNPSITSSTVATGTLVGGNAGSISSDSLSASSSALARNSPSTKQLVDQMDERLTTMQQVMTPIEIQRLQQHAYHIVKIPKSIKMRLLLDHLIAARKSYIRRLTVYTEQLACTSFSREVKLDDARAIVQSGASWGSFLGNVRMGQVKERKPIFQLYSGEKQQRHLEELIRRGVQLTLESDPEQRAVVERQRQRQKRRGFDAGMTPSTGPGSPPTGSFWRLDASNAARMAPASPSNVGSIQENRKLTRKLTFAIPATLSEKKNG